MDWVRLHKLAQRRGGDVDVIWVSVADDGEPSPVLHGTAAGDNNPNINSAVNSQLLNVNELFSKSSNNI